MTLRYVDVDLVLPLAEIGPAIVHLVKQPRGGQGELPVSDTIDLESDIVPFSCPDCGGVLVEYYDGDLLRFRCQVGHAFSRDSMVSSHAEYIDRSLWAAFAALDERRNLAERIARDAERQGDRLSQRRFERLAQQAEARKQEIRQALLKTDDAPVNSDPGTAMQPAT